MSDPKNTRDEQVDPTHEDAEEKLEDLETSEDDAVAVKGGGPKDQTIQTGGGPIE